MTPLPVDDDDPVGTVILIVRLSATRIFLGVIFSTSLALLVIVRKTIVVV